MNLLDLIHRAPIPAPWAEGEKIPWDDPDFSRRMLREHLSQEHDAASRRAEKIDRQVSWIHSALLESHPSRILDLGCGPGLYASRLARLGHSLVGIDFSPASIEYARKAAQEDQLDCVYLQADLRQVDFPLPETGGYDLVMFIYGELNAFHPENARLILRKAFSALRPGGLLLLELSTFESVRQMGLQPARWSTHPGGLFSDGPYLYLYESFWDEVQSVTTERHWVVEAASQAVARYTASTQAYADEEVLAILLDYGFSDPQIIPSLLGVPDPSQADFQGVLARRSL